MPTNLTELFLGDPAGWDACTLALLSVHTLWGGHLITVAGGGATTVRLVERGASHERRYQFDQGRTQAQALLRLCIKHDLLATSLPHRPHLIPDEAHTLLELSRDRRRFGLSVWAADEQPPGLRAILDAILALRARTDGLEPVYSGPYRG
ncbi:MAG: hypothetical protein OHK0022_49120 [Roseiflexaceae bacterium]